MRDNKGKGDRLFEEVLVQDVDGVPGTRFNLVYLGEPRDPVDVPEAALASMLNGTFFEPGALVSSGSKALTSVTLLPEHMPFKWSLFSPDLTVILLSEAAFS